MWILHIFDASIKSSNIRFSAKEENPSKGMLFMKKRVALPFIIILLVISACSLKELGPEVGEMESENEEVELYEKKFQDKSENWEVRLHLKEYQTEHIFTEENIFRFNRLKGIDDSIGFNFEMIYGDPIKYTVTPLNKTIFSQNQDEYQVKLDQQRIIEEVCFDQFTLKIIWNRGAEEPQEESYIFQDHENPMCENIDRIAPED